ncbi:helix-turn-helix transcriptional regulator [Enterococcus sp. RIT-PI-f]|uniref:helix-turn-helix transcriptional regulator n=1 Tax=Enterococcus sp. RIT-PI-f TaxID=1690244 RepID=UPI0006B8CC8A|nr:helix-turn-helix domain-containing protein [Enterococcus sp. RIT-PI-f]KPG73770.1 hypothetical protein AEQ18_00515 [Enterococcus sp. RIT-PI-f]
MKFFSQKEHTFKQRLRMISFLFCLPIIIIALGIRVYLNGPIQTEFIKKHNVSVLQEVDYLNQQIGQIEILSSVWGQNLMKQFSIVPLNDSSAFQKIMTVSQDLFRFKNSNPLIKNCEVFIFSEESFVIGDGGTWSIQDESLYEEYRISNDKEYQWVLTSSNQLLFLQNISSVSSLGEVFLVTTMNKPAMLELLALSSIENGGSALSIDGKMIVSTGIEFDENYIIGHANRMSTWQETIDTIQYSFVTAKMARLAQNWLFYSVSPITTIAQPIHRFSDILLFIGVALFLFFVALGQVLVKRQLKPMDSMLNDIFGNENWQPHDGNEFDSLRHEWQQIMERKSMLEHIQQTHIKQDKELAVSRVIDGKYSYLTEAEVRNQLFLHGWKQSIAHYHLCYVFLAGNMIDDNQEINLNHSQAFILENLIRDIASRSFQEYAVCTFSEEGMLLFIPNESQASMDQFINLVNDFGNRIIKKYVMVITQTNVQEVQRLAKYAQLIVKQKEYRKIIPENQRIVPETVKHVYPTYLEERIIRKIERHDCAIRDDLDAFITHLLGEHNQQGFLIKGLGRLYDKIHFILFSRNISENFYISKTNLLKELAMYTNAMKVSEDLYTFFIHPILNLLIEQQKNKTDIAVEKAITYLRQEYRNPMLSLEETANFVDLEMTQLSREFKRVMQINFIDYLTELRLEISKRELLNSSMKINEIAESVGYTSSYFNRLFKRKYGITPGQYRQSQ